MAKVDFEATTAYGATTAGGATTGDWIDLPEWAPDIDYMPTGAATGWEVIIEPTAIETTFSGTTAASTGVATTITVSPALATAHATTYTATKVVLESQAVVKGDRITLCYREAGALVRT